MKNEKISKFALFLNQKTNYTFGTRIKCSLSFFIFLKKWKMKYSLFFVFHFHKGIEKQIT